MYVNKENSKIFKDLNTDRSSERFDQAAVKEKHMLGLGMEVAE